MRLYDDRKRHLEATKDYEVAFERRIWTFASSTAGEVQMWTIADRVDTMFSAFEATGKCQYMLHLSDILDLTLGARSDKQDPPIIDEHRGETVPAWVKIEKDGRDYAYEFYGGRLAGLHARWAFHAEADPHMRRSQKRRILDYYAACVETANWMDKTWVEGPGEKEGFHGRFTYPGVIVPMNYVTFSIELHLWLFLLTGGAGYRDKVEKALMFWRNRTTENGWNYWDHKREDWDIRVDDWSHAASTVNVLIDCYRAGFDVPIADLEDLARRFLACMRFDGAERFLGWTERLDGTGRIGDAPDFSDRAWQSTRLGWFDERINTVMAAWSPADSVKGMHVNSALMLCSQPIQELKPSTTFTGPA